MGIYLINLNSSSYFTKLPRIPCPKCVSKKNLFSNKPRTHVLRYPQSIRYGYVLGHGHTEDFGVSVLPRRGAIGKHGKAIGETSGSFWRGKWKRLENQLESDPISEIEIYSM